MKKRSKVKIQNMSNLDALKANIRHEKNIIREIVGFSRHLSKLENLEKAGYNINPAEKKLFEGAIKSLKAQLKIINNSVPAIINQISLFKKIEEKEKRKRKEELVSLKYEHPSIEKRKTLVTIKKEDKLKYLRELSLTEESVKRLRKDYKLEKIKFVGFKKPSFYAKLSNKFFLKTSTDLLEKGRFAKLNHELRKANLPFLSTTYLSMAFFTSALSIFLGLFLTILLSFFKISISFPFLFLSEESFLIGFLKSFWLIFAIPVLTFLAFYFYPLTERKSISNKINQELPFVVIHMSAIAGSGVEPSKIFRIIVTSEEYPNTTKELKKLLNQINLYGYDLVNALREGARITSSPKLSELFNGLATTITSGGNLKEFLEKRAESLIFDYKIERDKYTHMAETFMDVYISVVIAAPMIMTLLLIMMHLTGLSFGFSLTALAILMLLVIAIVNVLFLTFLHLKQPKF